MNTVAVAMVCKTPTPGQSKTRLSPPLSLEDCAALSACFIQDVAATIGSLGADTAGYAVYTPEGSEAALRPLLPASFRLLPQSGGDLGRRLTQATSDLFQRRHAGVVMVGADSPTLPRGILQNAVAAVLAGDNVVLSPAFDGGYTLIGLSRPHPEVFAGIPWSTADVHRATVERARAAMLSVIGVAPWYDVDDAASLDMLRAELDGTPPSFAAADTRGGDAPATRRFLAALSRTTL